MKRSTVTYPRPTDTCPTCDEGMKGFPSRHRWLAIQRCVSATSKNVIPRFRPCSRRNFESAILGLDTVRAMLYTSADSSAGKAFEELKRSSSGATAGICSCDSGDMICGSGAAGSCCALQSCPVTATAMHNAAHVAIFRHAPAAAAETQAFMEGFRLCCLRG